jgi:IS605 OrfB family transposase
MVVRVIAKVSDAYKVDHSRQRRFQRFGGLAYDDRILRYRAASVSIWTVGGRLEMSFVCSKQQRAVLARRAGESDLVMRRRTFYLHATANIQEEPAIEAQDVLGVDLGIVNIAADSDGNVYSGAQLTGLRHRHRRIRRRLQKKGTRSARRLLRRRRRKEALFATATNHLLSKRLVAEAQGTARAIALEELRGIRERVSVARPQRATLHSWAFEQLRQFVAYKARLKGIPVVYVDPRNTSRTCPACGLVDKRNRPTQAQFRCVGCGLAGNADTIAALNIRARGRGVVVRPYAASAGACVETLGGNSRLLQLAVHSTTP